MFMKSIAMNAMALENLNKLALNVEEKVSKKEKSRKLCKYQLVLKMAPLCELKGKVTGLEWVTQVTCLSR